MSNTRAGSGIFLYPIVLLQSQHTGHVRKSHSQIQHCFRVSDGTPQQLFRVRIYIVPRWEFFQGSFLDILKLLHRKKKAQRTLGFFTNGGLKLHTCLCDESKDSSINGATAIHTVSGKELKKKKNARKGS